MDEYEVLREQFRPTKVKVLFVGESRPFNGTFFYRGDSRLAKYTCRAFQADGGAALDMPGFLEQFCLNGCFLIDLCCQPVNHLPLSERRRRHRAGATELAEALSVTRPKVIVVVMKAISRLVLRAVELSAINTFSMEVLPFPAQGHEKEYVRRLREIIACLRRAGVLQDR